jgi:hypothetical protein
MTTASFHLNIFKRKHRIDWNDWTKTKSIITGKKESLNPKGVEPSLKAYFLYFDHQNICKLAHKKVKEGEVDIEGKRFHVDLSKPLLWHKGIFGFQKFEPLFLIKWNEIYPEQTVNPVDPQYMTDNKVSPEMLKKTMGLKIIGNMLKSPREVNWFFIVLAGIGFGIFLTYYLIALKVIKI